MLALASLIACSPAPHGTASGDGVRRAPPRPGESITHTMMCSCQVCEPERCCRELEQDRPEPSADCADGYDFSKCEMPVSSCNSRCFQHRWRTRVEVGCAGSRPTNCCHAQADM
jgi:hypothetical protein